MIINPFKYFRKMYNSRVDMENEFSKFFSGKKVLVTGGCGFIGSHLVEKLCSVGAKVTIFDNMMRGNESFRNLSEIFQNYNVRQGNAPEIVIGDVLDFEKMKELVARGFDFIYHLAALPSHRLALERPRDYATIDLIGTVNVLEAVRINKTDTIIIYGSSNKVYGKQEPPWQEDKPTIPEGPYGQAKASSEEFCKQYFKYFGVKSVIIRYHHVAGTRSNSDLALAIFTERVLKGLPPEVHGKMNGDKFESCSADYTHVDDVVRASLLAAMNYKGFDIFNVANKKLTSVLWMAETVIKILNSDLKPKLVKMLPHETLVHHSDVSKAKKKLGFEAEIPIEKAIRDYIEWRLKFGENF